MRSILKIFLVVIISIIMASNVLAACNVDYSNFTVELRSDQDGYASTIYAENNSQIDIKISFNINNITDQSDCANNISAKAEVFRWNNNTNNWDKIRTTSTKSQALEEDVFTFTWSNDFSVSNNYERYKVEGFILEGTNELDRKESFIDVENNTCTGIVLKVTNFEINEESSKREYFYIENNTNRNFDISNAEVTFSVSGITSGNVDYPNRVNSNSTGNVDVTLNAGSVGSDRTITGRFRVSGYLGNEFCSVSALGEKTFDVKIKDTGTSGGSSSSTSGVCSDLELRTHNFEMNEASNAQEIFYLKNNSTKRFEILEVKVSSSGVNLETFYLEKYAFPNNLSNIVVKAEAGNVTQNRLYENSIQVRGRFSDGQSCSFTNIGEKKFNITVKDSQASTIATCSGFSIDVENNVSLTNAGVIPFTITNGTNRTANIYVETDLQVSPSIITMPANSSISRELSVSLLNNSGVIYLRPVVTGCQVSGQTITITNNASGELGQVTINTRVEETENITKLIVEFDNPTNKFFVGVLSFSGNGWVAEDRIITVVPGKSFTEIILNKAGPSQSAGGKIKFTSNANTIEKDVIIRDNQVISGLFGLGASIGGIGLLLIIIIIAVVIVVYLVEKEKTDNQRNEIKEPWETY